MANPTLPGKPASWTGLMPATGAPGLQPAPAFTDTIAYSTVPLSSGPPSPALMETLGYDAPTASLPPSAQPAQAFTETMAYADVLPGVPAASAVTSSRNATAGNGSRSTVLPRVESASGGAEPTLILHSRERYEPLRTLGRGGVGEVELVQDHDIQRTVAVKRLRPDRTNTEAVARFVQEIRTVGQLEHPNIVPIHDVGMDDQGRYYFMMKYVDGQTVEDIIKALQAGDPAAHARFPFAQRVQLFLSILQAVSYAHAHGVIHRDIKPANIMVGRFGEVMVMDWGLARQVGVKDAGSGEAPPENTDLYKTHHDSLLGTPAYMSPEQASLDQDLDVRSDIYSLSVLFHELLFLHHYLEGAASLSAMLKGVKETNPHPVGAEPPHPHQTPVPLDLAYYLRKGMAKDPAKRFQSVPQMMAELQDIQAGKIQVYCQLTAMKRGTHELTALIDRHPRAAIVLSSLLFFLAVGGVVALATMAAA